MMQTLLRVIPFVLALPAGAESDLSKIPAQEFVLDGSHSSVSFTVSHLGFSNYTAGFDEIEGTLVLDPEDPSSARVVVRIPVASLDLPSPPAGFHNTLMGRDWFDAEAHPLIEFASEYVTLDGENAAMIEGTLTLKGVTRPVFLKTVFNGGYDGLPYEPGPRVGFSATTSFNRSDFNMSFGAPPDGTNFGVGDEITVSIETEWTGTERIE